ncbi:MAG: PAS domain S-box protein [Desulfobacteraceae bacterium]|nr:PAS domain S-box protein [Desulfobacteraceae bacterium]
MMTGLKNKFLIPTVVIILMGMGVFAVISFAKARSIFTHVVIEEIDQIAETTVGGMATWMKDRRIDIKNWSQQRLYATALQLTFLGKTARTYANRQLKKMKESYGYYEDILIADPAGEILASSDTAHISVINVNDRDFFQEAMKGNIHVSSEVIKSNTSGNLVFMIASPIMENKKVIGVLFGVLKVDDFINQFVTTIHIGENSYAYVLKKDGEIIAHSKYSQFLGTNIADLEFGGKMLGRQEGILEYKLRNAQITAVFKTFHEIGLTIVVCARTHEILAPVKEMRNLFLAISFVIVILVTFSILIIADSVASPIKDLVKGLEKMGQGHLSYRITPKSNDEIGNIGHALNQMAFNLEKSRNKINIQNILLTKARDELEHKVEERTRDFKKAEKEYRSLFENAIEGIFRITPDGRYINANPALAKVLGYDGPKELSFFSKRLFVSPDDFKRIDTLLQTQGEIVGFETRIIRKNMTHCWCSISVQCVTDTSGNLSYYEGSLLDISERIEKENALREREAAVAANRLKSEFIANMSHEIRTPLNVVTGFCGLLFSMSSDPKQQSYINSIKSAGESLLTLINDILDLSKMEAGKLEIINTTVSIRALIDQIEQMFKPIVLDKGVEFHVEIKNEFAFCLLLDEVRLRQILVNLVGNATKFTDQGHIKLIVQQKRAPGTEKRCDLHITVEDTGIGIDEANFKKVFESFEQLDSSIMKKYGGTGLGLQICKRLANAMGGRIEVSSTLGAGSTFTVVLKDVKEALRDNYSPAYQNPVNSKGADAPSSLRLISRHSESGGAIHGDDKPLLDPHTIPQAFKTVLREELLPWSQSLKEAIIVNDVMSFAQRLQALAKEHHIMPLIGFSRELIEFTDFFDIHMIQRKLEEFSSLGRIILNAE